MGITGHFLEDNELKDVSLGLHNLNSAHTSEYIQTCIESVLESWGIAKDKVVLMVTDGAANIVKAASDTFGKNMHLHCCAHILHLIASKVLEVASYKAVLEKIKTIVTFFKQSVKAADMLKDKQINVNNDENAERSIPLKLIQSTPTRWNSSFLMCERYIKLSSVVTASITELNLLADNSKTKLPDTLTNDEFTTARKIISLLGPMEDCTKRLSTQKFGSASVIIPIANCLKRVAREKNDSILTAEIEKRFQNIEKNTTLAVCTLLDPRFKKADFTDAVSLAKTLQFISKEVAKINNDQSAMEKQQIKTPKPSSAHDIWAYRNCQNSEIGNFFLTYIFCFVIGS